MGDHKPYSGRHRKPSKAKIAARNAAVAGAGAAVTGMTLLGSPAAAQAAPMPASHAVSAKVAAYDHQRHLLHLAHLAYLESLKKPVTAVYHALGVYSFSGLETLWRQAGGSAGTEVVAACIATHESGGNTTALSPTDDWGLWQIHAGGYAMFNPLANAERAVAMSSDGTNWGAWTTAPDCGV